MLRSNNLRVSPDEAKATAFNLQLVSIRGSSLSCFGVSPEGLSVCLHIDEFAPTFLLVPIDPAFDELDDLEEETRTVLDGEEPVIQDMEWVERVKAIYFTKNEKHKIVRVTCTSVNAFFLARKHFRKNKKFHVCDDYAPILQFFHQSTEIAYQSWVDLSNARPVARKRTTCNLEYRVKDVHALRLAADQTAQPKILKCFLALQAVSRDGVLHSKPLHPNPDRLCDRVVSVRLGFAWTGESSMFHTETHSVLPCDDAVWHASEAELLQAVRDAIVNWDPDDLMCYPDHIDPFVYMFKRATLLRRVNECCGWERVVGNAPSMFRDRFQCRTRSQFSCLAALKKKVTVRCEDYSLYVASAHKDLRSSPVKSSFPSRTSPPKGSMVMWSVGTVS